MLKVSSKMLMVYVCYMFIIVQPINRIISTRIHYTVKERSLAFIKIIILSSSLNPLQPSTCRGLSL